MRIQRNDGRAAGAGRRRAAWAAPLVLAPALALAACDLDGIMNVGDPDVAAPSTLQDPAVIGVVYAGAIADFQLGFVGTGLTGGGQTGEGQVLISAMLSDEAYLSGTFTSRREVSQRNIDTAARLGMTTNANLIFAERWLHRARRAAENAAEAFEAAELGNDTRRAEMFALAGFTYILFGEHYCSGVSFSQVPRLGGPPAYGPPTPTDEIFERAIARFDAALAVAGISDAIASLARVGKARALMNLDRYQEAAALATEVPHDFRYVVYHSDNTARQENPVFHYAIQQGRYAVPNRLGQNGIRWLEHEAAGDPRVQTFARTAFDTPLGQVRVPAKYARTTATPVATGIEARLIQAEAALARGASGDYVGILNQLRAGLDLEPLTDPMDPAARVDQFFEERALWLWLTAHRLGDLRRLVRQYDRSVDQVFPTGPHGWYTAGGDFVAAAGGGTFGSDVNLPFHLDEGNNPQAAGCINRDARRWARSPG
jgi:starch-binding outer membrane protein, SusD/RagB family